ncbi:MAG: dTMP kinase [Hydrococcus sp. Prado102]|jgi:dTMP kinase|nr:dTMP kinase [Hydrococcus sp. Prado102]
MKPLFIVLEGIDGSGTSTQAALLKDYFIKRGDRAIVSPEPSEGIIGKLLRQALQNKKTLNQDGQKFDEQMAYLFAADRHYHLYNNIDGVFKSIEQDNTYVITPRYYFSSLAYNCNTQQEFEFVSNLNKKFPNPALVIYLDIPVDVALIRISDRVVKDVYENAHKLLQVKQNYQTIFDNYDGLLLKIDGTKDKDKINQIIINFIKSKINN